MGLLLLLAGLAIMAYGVTEVDLSGPERECDSLIAECASGLTGELCSFNKKHYKRMPLS